MSIFVSFLVVTIPAGILFSLLLSPSPEELFGGTLANATVDVYSYLVAPAIEAAVLRYLLRALTKFEIGFVRAFLALLVGNLVSGGVAWFLARFLADEVGLVVLGTFLLSFSISASLVRRFALPGQTVATD